jgi:choice-of-anchor B domain-containing protein
MMFIPTQGYSQTSLNMEYFGNLNEHSLAGSYAAIWGYTTPTGHEYALLACYNGTAIIDITGPSLLEVDFVPGPVVNASSALTWREMKTYLHYAYIVSESTNPSTGGVQIVDLSYLPDSVSLVNRYVWRDTVGMDIFSYPAVHSVSVSGHYLYLNGGSGSPYGMRILDISDPVNPVKAGVLVSPYVHDSYVRNDTVFAAAINQNTGLMIYDATNKSNLVELKQITYPGAGTHNAWTTPDRRYVLTTDEIGSTPKTLKIWDIEDLNNVTGVADFTNTGAIVHNVFVKGNLAYVAWYTAGLRVVDISNPQSPVEVGYYDTYPANDNAGYAGNWGADPFFPSGKVVLSDMQTGLHVVRYAGDKRGIVKGLVYDHRAHTGLEGVRLEFPDLSITRWTDAGGNYIFGYAPGTYRVRLERSGFGVFDTSITVIEAQTTTVDFAPSVLTSVGEPAAEFPAEFQLDQNYPNPFNPTTRIPYSVAARSKVRIAVYTILGKEIAVLLDDVKDPGTYTVSFNAASLPSGVYFYQMTAGSTVQTRRMMVVR